MDTAAVSDHGSTPPTARGHRTLWTLAILALIAWGAVGWTFVGILDQFRSMILLPIEAWGATGRIGRMLGFFGATFPASLLGFTVMMRAGRASGHVGIGMSASTAITFGGLAAGLGAAAASWRAPKVVGETAGPDGRQPWGPVEWIAYAAPAWLPGVLGVVALAAGSGLLIQLLRARSASDRREELERTGQRTAGRIVDVVFTNVWIMGDPRFAVTVEYPTSAGTVQTTTTMVVDAMHAPMPGAPVTVLFDGDDPTNVLRAHIERDASQPMHPHGALFMPRD